MVKINRDKLIILKSYLSYKNYPSIIVADYGYIIESGIKIYIEDKDKFVDNFIKKIEENFGDDFDIEINGINFTRDLEKEGYEITLNLYYTKEIKKGLFGHFVISNSVNSKKPLELPDKKLETLKVYEISSSKEKEEFDVTFLLEGVMMIMKSLKYLDNIPEIQSKIISQTELVINPIDPKYGKAKFEELFDKIYNSLMNVYNFFQ